MLEVFIDGASAGNPGASGIGIFIKGEGNIIKISEVIEDTNNHVAEFKALIRGLEEVKKIGTDFVWMRSDSKIVVASIEKKYVKSEEFKPYLEEALAIIETFPTFFIKWIPDKENRAADALARQAIQTQKSAIYYD